MLRGPANALLNASAKQHFGDTLPSLLLFLRTQGLNRRSYLPFAQLLSCVSGQDC